MCDSFNYVELDIKLEQSIQRESKSQTLMFAVVAEFELISHDILVIQFDANVSGLLDFVRAARAENVW